MESKDEGVSVADINVINDMETQSNTVLDTENSLTESKIMDNVVIHSTPIQNKQSDSNDIMNMMQLLLEKQNTMSVSYTHLDVYKRQTWRHPHRTKE